MGEETAAADSAVVATGEMEEDSAVVATGEMEEDSVDSVVDSVVDSALARLPTRRILFLL
jgi:hypothetical protein